MPFRIRNLSIRDQILLLTLPPLLVLFCAIAFSLFVYSTALRTGNAAQKFAAIGSRGESLLRNLTGMYTDASGYLLMRQPSLLAAYQASATEVFRGLSELRELVSDDPSAMAEVDATREDVNRWQAQWIKPNLDKARRGETVASAPVLEEVENRMDVLRRRILKLLEVDKARRLDRMQEAGQLMRRVLAVSIGVAILIAAVSFFLTRAVARSIAQPLLQLIEASEQVTRGEFHPSLPPPAENEFGVLSRSFSRMTAALRQEREEMAALNKFSEAVAQSTTEREVYEHVLYTLKERFHPRQVIIFKLNPHENFLEAAASLVPLPENLRPWPVIEEPHNCKAVRMGRCFLANDVTAEPLCPANFVPPSEGSYYCGPLIAGGIISGAIRLEGIKDYWTPERVSLVESYLSGAASALSNLRLLETMKQQASVDVLTSLYNRRFLEDYARKQIAMARRRTQPLGLIMLDLDHFKSFNDIYGHEVGDRILRQFAKTVTGAMRETNLAARFGGEEFVVLLPDTGAQACLGVAERIRQAVAKMVITTGGDKPLPRLTVSLGIAVYPDHGQTVEELLHASDKALYESKRAGRNRVTLYVEQPNPARS